MARPEPAGIWSMFYSSNPVPHITTGAGSINSVLVLDVRETVFISLEYVIIYLKET